MSMPVTGLPEALAVPADLSFVTLADFQAFMKQSGTPEAATKKRLEEALGAATEAVQRVVGPLDNAGHTYRVHPSGRRHLVLNDTHLVAVTSVTDPIGRPLAVDMRFADLEAGILTWWFPLYPGMYTVVATTREHGFSVRMAIKVIGSHLYDVYRGGAVVYPEGTLTTPDDPIARRIGFAIPRRAAELLVPFVRGS